MTDAAGKTQEERWSHALTHADDRMVAAGLTALKAYDGYPVDESDAEFMKGLWSAMLAATTQPFEDEMPASAGPISCAVRPMRLSGNRTEFWVCVSRGGREITPHCHGIKGRAEYEVARWNWVLNGGAEPCILDYDDEPPARKVASVDGPAYVPHSERLPAGYAIDHTSVGGFATVSPSGDVVGGLQTRLEAVDAAWRHLEEGALRGGGADPVPLPEGH